MNHKLPVLIWLSKWLEVVAAEAKMNKCSRTTLQATFVLPSSTNRIS